MKLLIATTLFALASLFGGAAIASDAKAPETKKVCVDEVKDGKPVLDKSGKPKQVCKDVKVHKKLEGTPIPDKK